MSTPAPLLEARGVALRLGGREVLRGIDLALDAGARVGLVGPNGAGKSSLLRVLAGVLEPDAGTVRVRGESGSAARSSIGLAFDLPALHPDAPLASSLAFAARLHGVPERAIEDRVRDALARAGLVERARVRADRLSFGERRRAGLAQATIHDPPVVLLDEPSAGLDPIQRGELADWIDRLPADRALLVSSHDLDDLAQSCARVVVLDAGRVVADGGVDAVVGASVGDTRLEIEIEIGGEADAALAVLAGASIARRGERATWVRLRARAGERGAIVARLVAAGVEVRGIGPRRPWLAEALAAARTRSP